MKNKKIFCRYVILCIDLILLAKHNTAEYILILILIYININININKY